VGTWLFVAMVIVVWAIAMAIVVVLERRSPAATMAWILVLALVPIFGWLIYTLIGPRRLERKRLKRKTSRKVIEEAVGAILEIDDAAPYHHRSQLARLAQNLGEAGPLRAQAIDIYTEGAAAFAEIFAAIEGARHHVHLEYYIWEPGRLGTQLRDLLIARAQAGIEIRLILDGTGAAGIKESFLRPLRAVGAQVAWFNPVRLRSLRRRRADFRSHRKIVVVDGTVAFTGGMNVADDQTATFTGAAAWRDTHLRLAGSAVRALQRIFAEDWYFTTNRTLAGGPYYPAPASPARPGESGGEVVQVIGSGPDGDAFAIHKMLFAAITQATERLWVTTPYFVPDEAIMSALLTTALRGVDVQLLVPDHGDSRLVDLAARSYYPELLRAGGRVFLYQPRFLHAKTMVVDDDLAIVGSANLDNRSFRLDFEVAVVCYGGSINARLDHAFRDDLSHARELSLADVARVPLWSRLGQATARLMSPLL
jgi:cardiolipin synthase